MTQDTTASVESPVKNKNQERPNKQRHTRVFVYIGSTLFAVALIGLIGFYHQRALPNVQLAGIAVNGKNKAELTQVALEQEADLRFSFSFQGKTVTASAADAGVTVNVPKTVQDALNARRTSSIFKAIQLWKSDNIPLVIQSNTSAFTNYVATQFPNAVRNPQNASLVYNSQSQQYVIQSDSVGQAIALNSFEESLPNLAAHPRIITLPITDNTITPTVLASSLTTIQQQLNARLNAGIKLVYNGQTIYTASPSDIASWVVFTTHSNGTITYAYDPSKIVQFLTQQVGPSIATPPQNENVVNETDTGQSVVVQQGQNGMQLQGMPALAANITTALSTNQSSVQNVSIATAAYKTVTYNTSLNDRWIDVNLTSQTATLYVDSTPVASYIIASGVPPEFATATGTFHVWYKDLSQTMTGGSIADGDYYNLPDVTWVSYFDGQEALHTAYWLSPSQFGRPESHGCINMTAADAKIVYYFAPIGTKVVVNY
jgi:lipoprotein-anchoring transpeptidase ErfK/SrfK